MTILGLRGGGGLIELSHNQQDMGLYPAKEGFLYNKLLDRFIYNRYMSFKNSPPIIP